MTDSPQEQGPPTKAPGDVAAKRVCLRCRTVFSSEGFGERICPRCKSSTFWKTALPLRETRSGKR